MIYFLSNEKYEYSRMKLYSFAMSDTVKEDKRIVLEMPQVSGFYSINDSLNRIVFSSIKSRKSQRAPDKGGDRLHDIFIDQLPDHASKKIFRKKTEKQLSEKMDFFHAALSPAGDAVACTRRVNDRFLLYLTDTTAKNPEQLYPVNPDEESAIRTMFSIDWSPDSQSIAISYIDRSDRKIGIFNIRTRTFTVICDTPFDERDPRFSSDGKRLYFSSDRSGIFNIYRYDFASHTLERLTNVSGGAFTPDATANERKLVFTSYDDNGYGIYIIDSVAALEHWTVDRTDTIGNLAETANDTFQSPFPQSKPYSYFPRKFLLVPAFVGEQVLTKQNNAFSGLTNFKIGFITYLFDPLDIVSSRGNSLTGMFLYDPGDFLFDRNDIINKKANYDLGLFAHTARLPVDLDFSYYQRSVTGRDYFNTTNADENSSGNASIEYKLAPNFLTFSLTHKFFGDPYGYGYAHAGIHYGYDFFKVWVRMDEDVFETYDKYFGYTPTKGHRIGGHITLSQRDIASRSSISPTGMGLKVEYDFCNQLMQNEINSFSIKNGSLQENYHAPYQYNQITVDLLLGKPVPVIKKHDLFLKVNGIAAQLTNASRKRLQMDVDRGYLSSTDIPSFMQPAVWVPGYAYYYKDTLQTILHEKGSSTPPETLAIYTDTALVSGAGVVSGGVSYRFPLFPGSIDKKLGFLYIDKLYGALNFGGAAAVNRLSDFMDIRWKDLLLYRGLELRLEAISFNTMPMAISFRWDYGIDRKPPVGGHKLSFMIGFDFDYWDIVVEPKRNRFAPRMGL
jgi:hypothetical protein